ncbi:VCBS repeat-containing protein [Marinoscillum furvescens]|uniref:VCBS repeat protein n=1 Tax=Marinoscillum furvescens DSM 4134 TaxID=1122208 RepID=A0A3D9L0N7_MARFU|nr:VCBS repeat-containing protein [Marinoscillum furvescens]RED97013.1 VCBS repeat protein [Marinoscillum furvescens DSM 4134]
MRKAPLAFRMLTSMVRFVFYYIISALLIGCGSTSTEDYLFTRLSAEQTNVSFVNQIDDTPHLNGILYEYLYNGAGVAAEDFNADGLLDLYFVSSLGENQLYLNQGNFQFLNVTKKSGTSGGAGLATGVTVVDINADGLPDIYVCKSGKFTDPRYRKNELFLHMGVDEEGVPTFREAAAEFGLDLMNYSTQATFFDYDLDGDLDMFLINHGIRAYTDAEVLHLKEKYEPLQAEQLYENRAGSFHEVSAQAGLIQNGLSYGLGVAVGDFNNDSWPDVLVSHDYSERDHLYLNSGNRTFKEVLRESTGHTSFYSMGNDIADFNNDGLLDFITLDMAAETNYDIKTSMSGMNPKQFEALTENGFHFQYMYNALQLNRGLVDGVPMFSDVAQIAGVASSDWSWSPLFLDADNDGDKDLLVTNGVVRDFRNNDFLRYKEERFNSFFASVKQRTTETLQKARELTHELVSQMPRRPRPNRIYQNLGGIRFKDSEWLPAELTISNGATYADLDNDGDLDLITNDMNSMAGIYQNNGQAGNFITVKLHGDSLNPEAIGSRVTVRTESGLHQMTELYRARGFQSSVSARLHFGLDTAKAVEVRVRWTDGTYSPWLKTEANQELVIEKHEIAEVEAESPVSWLVNESKLLDDRFEHHENEFDDYERESLLPHRLSQNGPALAVADLNADGLDDIFIGGAHGHSGRLLLQNENGGFESLAENVLEQTKDSEDVSAVFADLDGDADLDLYVVSGGNEFGRGSDALADKIYLQLNGNWTLWEGHLFESESGGVVSPCDYDADGDVDLFIGNYQVPGAYPVSPVSYLLKNNSQGGVLEFEVVSLGELGMVTAASWADFDGDGASDLLVAGEWMSPVIFYNRSGTLTQFTASDLDAYTGWWTAVAVGDFDQDGDQDFVLGNNGLNYKYKASAEAPFEVYFNDFDRNGAGDIVLGFHEEGKVYPVRGRECTSNQIPVVKSRFQNYDAFARATLIDVFEEERLANSLHRKVTTFASMYFENTGGEYLARPLPDMAQISSIRSILPYDLNGDGRQDLIVHGNRYESEVETPRNDANYGMVLLSDSRGAFMAQPADLTGLLSAGNVRHGALVRRPQGLSLLYVQNDGPAQLFRIYDQTRNKNDEAF